LVTALVSRLIGVDVADGVAQRVERDRAPSGENAGDSGSSTDFIGCALDLRVSTFCTISARSFSVRTK
jgi:hypothetical protein